jgi:hypothetical protein
MKRTNYLFYFCLAAALIAALIYFFALKGKTSMQYGSDCDFDKGACVKKAGGIEVILDMSPKPVMTMRELEIKVELKGADGPDKIIISFDMPEMYMGKNEVVLKRINKGRISQLYEGAGLLPRCPSGKKLWRAAIDIPQTGQKPIKTEFVFNVSK